jgi:hypothetical protein
MECPSEKQKHRTMLLQFLRTQRGIAFSQLFAMTDYPHDIMPLYAEGYSLAEYLILHGGRRKYVQFLDEGLATDQWPAAVRHHYGLGDLGVLQNTWLAWVQAGFPLPAATAVAAAAPRPLPGELRRPRPEPNLIYHIRTQPTTAATVPTNGVRQTAATSPVGVQVLPVSGWHKPGAAVQPASEPQATETARPQPMEPSRQIILQ